MTTVMDEDTKSAGKLYASAVRQLEADYPPLDTAKLYEFVEICRVTWPDNPPDVTIRWRRPYGGYRIGVRFNGEQAPVEFDADELNDAYGTIERIKILI